MNPPDLQHPNYYIPFFLFVYVNKGNALGVLTHKQRNHHRLIVYFSQHLDLVAQGYPSYFRAIMVIAFSVKATEKIIVGSPLTFFVPFAAETFLKSSQTQNFSASHLTSFDILFFPPLHITLLYCYNFNPTTLLPIITRVFYHNYLTLMVHFLISHNVRQEIPLGNIEFSGLTDSSFLKGESGK